MKAGGTTSAFGWNPTHASVIDRPQNHHSGQKRPQDPPAQPTPSPPFPLSMSLSATIPSGTPLGMVILPALPLSRAREQDTTYMHPSQMGGRCGQCKCAEQQLISVRTCCFQMGWDRCFCSCCGIDVCFDQSLHL